MRRRCELYGSVTGTGDSEIRFVIFSFQKNLIGRTAFVQKVLVDSECFVSPGAIQRSKGSAIASICLGRCPKLKIISPGPTIQSLQYRR